MKQALALFFAVLLGFGCATSGVGASHTTIDMDGSSDTIEFHPKANTLFAKIAEAQQDAVIEMTDPDGFTYRMACGNSAKGMDSTAALEVMSAFIQAMPGMIDTAMGAIVQKAGIDAQKPPGMSNQDFLLQLVDKGAAIHATQAAKDINVKVTP